jgi:AcrR family transcriptional regulator
VRLADVAERLAISPSDVADYFRDLDSVANAWFQEGLKAMLAPKPADFAEAPDIDRLETCLLAWFDTMARPREVTAQMLSDKLHLSHPHHWAPMVFDLSRLIHWLRDVKRSGNGPPELENPWSCLAPAKRDSVMGTSFQRKTSGPAVMKRRNHRPKT